MKQYSFEKTLERDGTLVMNVLFDLGMVEDLPKRYGFTMPYRPLEINYASETSIQIWENTRGLQHFFDELLAKNQHGTAFIESVIADYTVALEEVRAFWKRGPVTDPGELQSYFDAVRRAVAPVAICFYVGLDARTPKDIAELSVAARKLDDFYANADEYVRACAEARGCKRDLAYLVTPDELAGEMPSETTLRERQKGLVLVDGDHIETISLPEFAAKHIEYIFKDLVTSDVHVTEIAGRTAYKGNVTGRVRVVKNRAQASTIQEGEILVAPMTTPDFLPAMQKAAAFVTDEGGITCHAAIVARELKKPCIIGTKIATQVLKDDDLVEVDAERGVVRILKKA